MPTNNERQVIIYCDELKNMIREEVSKFREVISEFMRQREREEHFDEKPLNIQQVADRYGKSKQTVHNWIKQGLITGFKQGKGRYFYRHELDKKLSSYKFFDLLQKAGEIPQGKNYYHYLREQEGE